MPDGISCIGIKCDRRGISVIIKLIVLIIFVFLQHQKHHHDCVCHLRGAFSYNCRIGDIVFFCWVFDMAGDFIHVTI